MALASSRSFRFFACCLLGLLAFGDRPAGAQSVGSCTLGTASAELDLSGVRARLFNKGNLFFNHGHPNYEVPKGSGITSIFASTIWVGGLVDGELRIAAASYAQFGQNYEFYPGPLDADGTLPSPNDCTPYDRIYTVSQVDLARYDERGVASDDLAEWPGHLGAPFWDVDGDGAYDLAAGDRPKVWGTQTAWWVMNDAGGPHRTTLSEPMGMEVRVTAFASASPVDALHYTTFYRYELTYRGAGAGSAPLDSAYFTLFIDPDLGNFNDDYIGSDTTRHLGFVYNADNDDEGGDGYGVGPPAQGFRWLETPGGQGMTVFGYFVSDNNARTGNPYMAEGYRNFMMGRWKDRSPVTVGGTGADPSGTPTTFVYTNSGTLDAPEPGYWSEVCPTPNCATPIQPSDRRFHTSTGPFRMESGDTEVVTIALVWARGEDNFDSLQQMKLASDYVERAYRLGALDPVAPTPVEPEPPEGLALAGPFPNPFRSEAAFRLRVPEGAGAVRVAAYDVLGREVAVLHDGALPPGEHTLRLDGGRLPAGLYVVRFTVAGGTRTVKVVRVE